MKLDHREFDDFRLIGVQPGRFAVKDDADKRLCAFAVGEDLAGLKPA